MMKIGTVSEVSKRISSELGKAIVGKDLVLRKMLLGLLTNSHILIEDFPGLAKTMIAKTLGSDSVHLFPSPVHPRSSTRRHNWNLRIQPENGRFRTKKRAHLHQHSPCRRDKPQSSEDTGGTVGSDAGTPDHS